MSALLDADQSPIARLRAATLLEQADHIAQAMTDIKICLKSGDRDVRSHALALLILAHPAFRGAGIRSRVNIGSNSENPRQRMLCIA